MSLLTLSRPSKSAARAVSIMLLAATVAACSIDPRQPDVPLGGGVERRALQPADDAGCSECGQSACTPGVSRCTSPTHRAICSVDGAWSDGTPCEFACRTGACAGECVPGSSECVTTTLVRSCSAAGDWQATEACANACAGGRCAGQCVPGAQRCASSAAVERCSELGEWTAPIACAISCSGAGCVDECGPGTVECFSPTQLRFCSDRGQWQTPISCPIACSEGACSGDCLPGSVRCDPDDGAPQRCDALGQWQAPIACSGSVDCVEGSLARCGGACTSTDSDPAHCGRCDHDCQGGACAAGRCEPAVLAAGLLNPSAVAVSATHVYFTESRPATGARVVRVAKAGGEPEVVAATEGDVGAPAIGGEQLYFASGSGQLALGPGRVLRANLDGSGAVPFSPVHPEGVARLIVPGLFVYYTVRDAALTTVFRAPLLSAGDVGAGMEALFETAPGPLLSMTVVNGCLFYVDQNTPRQLLRKCAGSVSAAARSVGAGAIEFLPRAANDAAHLYFTDGVRGLVRVPLDPQGADEVVAPDLFGAPTVAEDALYSWERVGPSAGPCSTTNALFRAGKEPGSSASEVLPAPIACPTAVAVDDAALYWTSGDGSLLRLVR